MLTSFVSYTDHNTPLEGFVAYPSKEKRPAVILCHSWKGRDEFICQRAKLMAEWGYVGFALDMYGKGVLGQSRDENAALKKPFLDDRLYLRRRLLKAFEVVCQLPYVDVSRIAVVGLGFGGLCALDLARSGLNIKGVVSIYGHFDPPKGIPSQPIQMRVLALHGYNDPIVSQQELQVFEKEMEASGVDWEVHLYGMTLHAFATPGVDEPSLGIQYNPKIAERAWKSIRVFLEDIFTGGT